MTNIHQPDEAFALEPDELRVAAARPPKPASLRVAREGNRLGIAAAITLGTICLLGAGFGAYEFMGASSAKRSIKAGPLAEMPEIRNGVPGLMPGVRAAAAPNAVPLSPPERGDAAVEAANARAMALTLATASLRPGLGARAPEAAAAAPPLVPVQARVEPAPTPAEDRPASTAALPKPEPAAASPIDARRPASSPPVAAAPPEPLPASPEPARPVPAPPVPPAQAALAPPASLPAEPGPAEPPAPAPVVAPPLPPARPAEVAAARPAEPARIGAVFRPIPGPKGAPKPAQTVERMPPAAAPPARPAPPPAEERAEILGVPLPSFVPTGRDIRDAASSIADAVTSLPSRF